MSRTTDDWRFYILREHKTPHLQQYSKRDFKIVQILIYLGDVINFEYYIPDLTKLNIRSTANFEILQKNIKGFPLFENANKW